MAIMQGDLAEYPVPDILQFVQVTRKPGQLILESRLVPKPAGVYFADGEVIHAYCPPKQGVHAIYQLLQWNEGRFAFLKDAQPEKRTIFDDFQNLLLEGLRRLDEFNLLRDRLPSPDAVLYLSRGIERSVEVRLTQSEWRLLTLVNGRRSCAEILALSEKPENDGARILYGLLIADLVTIQHDDSYLSAIVLARVPSAEAPPQRMAPPTMLANLLLNRIDGRRDLRQIQTGLGCIESALLEEVQLLVRTGWIRIAAGSDEYQRFALG